MYIYYYRLIEKEKFTAVLLLKNMNITKTSKEVNKPAYHTLMSRWIEQSLEKQGFFIFVKKSSPIHTLTK